MEKPKCETCIFIVDGDIDPNDISRRQYFCRRYPPNVIVVPGPPNVSGGISVQVSSVHPMTTPLSFCGEWDDGSEDDHHEEIDV